jgi:hypothetical protein
VGTQIGGLKIKFILWNVRWLRKRAAVSVASLQQFQLFGILTKWQAWPVNQAEN